MRAKNILLIVCVLLAVSQLALAGGRDRAGTAGAQELLIPVGARGISLGGSNLSNVSGIDAIYWNPAGLADSKKSVDVMFSHMSYLADINVEYGAVAVNFSGFGSVALSIKTLGFGDISYTTEDAPDGIGTFSPSYITMGLTYSRQLTDRILVGANFKVVSEQIMRTSATGFAFDVGVQYHNLGDLKGFNIALALKNLGPDMRFDGSDLYRSGSALQTLRGSQLYKVEAAPFGVPSSLEMGLSYQKGFDEDNLLTVTGSFLNNNFADDEYKLGLEYNFKDLLSLRGAYSMAPQTPNKDDYIYGPSFGVGVHFFAGVEMTVDYGYRWTRYFDSNQVVSLTLGF